MKHIECECSWCKFWRYSGLWLMAAVVISFIVSRHVGFVLNLVISLVTAAILVLGMYWSDRRQKMKRKLSEKEKGPAK